MAHALTFLSLHVFYSAPQIFHFRTAEVPNVDRKALQTSILDQVFAGNMAAVYEYVAPILGVPVDHTKLAAMKEANAKKMEELAAKVKVRRG